jgi:NAD(P)-dependent dehydrogenase (short-subunit alcohol dehydrogenase family)
MKGLKGKNVLVTGGTSGIGQAIAVREILVQGDVSREKAAMVLQHIPISAPPGLRSK